MNKIDNILPFISGIIPTLRYKHIFVLFHTKKATAAPPDESGEELNDSSILSDSEFSDNDNVVKDGVFISGIVPTFRYNIFLFHFTGKRQQLLHQMKVMKNRMIQASYQIQS